METPTLEQLRYPIGKFIAPENYSPELIAQSWSDGGKPGTGEVVWEIGDLKPREQRTLTVKTRCDKLVKDASNRVVATASPGLSITDQVKVDVFGLPGLQLEVSQKDNPVPSIRVASPSLTLIHCIA